MDIAAISREIDAHIGKKVYQVRYSVANLKYEIQEHTFCGIRAFGGKEVYFYLGNTCVSSSLPVDMLFFNKETAEAKMNELNSVNEEEETDGGES